ncbi:hypothetical protein KIPB_011421, partial [Kipferlia bialata]|eukprot:g11421.t1
MASDSRRTSTAALRERERRLRTGQGRRMAQTLPSLPPLSPTEESVTDGSESDGYGYAEVYRRESTVYGGMRDGDREDDGDWMEEGGRIGTRGRERERQPTRGPTRGGGGRRVRTVNRRVQTQAPLTLGDPLNEETHALRKQIIEYERSDRQHTISMLEARAKLQKSEHARMDCENLLSTIDGEREMERREWRGREGEMQRQIDLQAQRIRYLEDAQAEVARMRKSLDDRAG